MAFKNGENWLISVIWSEHFWLPESTSWKDLKSNSTIQYPQFEELTYSVALGAIILILRLFFESFVYLPIGYAFGWMSYKKVFFFKLQIVI